MYMGKSIFFHNAALQKTRSIWETPTYGTSCIDALAVLHPVLFRVVVKKKTTFAVLSTYDEESCFLSKTWPDAEPLRHRFGFLG
jgi:hypothetical protein